jgi:hypothetical protein
MLQPYDKLWRTFASAAKTAKTAPDKVKAIIFSGSSSVTRSKYCNANALPETATPFTMTKLMIRARKITVGISVVATKPHKNHRKGLPADERDR